MPFRSLASKNVRLPIRLTTRLRTSSSLWLALLLASATGAACRSTEGSGDGRADGGSTASLPEDPPHGGQLESLGWASAWNEADRVTWYMTPQGSQLIDYGVFTNLEQANNTSPLADRANLESLGFVYAPKGTEALYSSDGLPLGVLKDVDPTGTEYVGLTCAACHTSEMRVNGKRLVVDGGQSFLRFEKFFAGLQAALHAATDSPEKHTRLCAAMKLEDVSCTFRVAESTARIDGISARSTLTVEGGPGRLDAISRILNELFAGQLGGEEAQPVAVPVSYPYVWDAPRLSCVQTDCISSNSLTRNIGETLGVFGHIRFDATGPAASTKIDNLYLLEKSLVSLSSPKWNEAAFGPLDAVKANKGGAIFSASCASCHGEPYQPGAKNRHPEYFLRDANGVPNESIWKVNTSKYTSIGTDPLFIVRHNARKVTRRPLDSTLPDLVSYVDSELKAAIAARSAPNPRLINLAFEAQQTALTAAGLRSVDGNSYSALLVLGVITNSLESRGLEESSARSGIPLDTLRSEYRFGRENPDPKNFKLDAYRARPLNGIAFSAPYGHNGAWPTLRSVITRSLDRPSSFPVRAYAFDRKDVGLDISAIRSEETDVFRLDTSLPGNSKAGHEIAVDLSDEDKDALLEYLKSI